MKILIVEDEVVAANSLQKLVKSCEPNAEIVAILPSVKKTIELLRSKPQLDLIFFDIHLADGTVFEVFEKVKPETAMIFTTAYDIYAVKAFELNSLDYLLKPIRIERLQQSLDRFKQQQPQSSEYQMDRLFSLIKDLEYTNEYKSRFLVKNGLKLQPIEVNQIAYFFRDEEVVQLVTFEKRQFIINYSLEELEGMLEPKVFFRLNRQFIANFSSLSSIYNYSKGKIKAKLGPNNHEVIISQKRAQLFKEWLER